MSAQGNRKRVHPPATYTGTFATHDGQKRQRPRCPSTERENTPCASNGTGFGHKTEDARTPATPRMSPDAGERLLRFHLWDVSGTGKSRGTESRSGPARGWGRRGAAANGHGVSLGVTDCDGPARLHGSASSHRVVRLKRVSVTVCELYLGKATMRHGNKAKQKGISGLKIFLPQREESHCKMPVGCVSIFKDLLLPGFNFFFFFFFFPVFC